MNDDDNRNLPRPSDSRRSGDDSGKDAEFSADFGRRPPASPPPEQHDHQRTGTSMYWAAAIIALALLTLFFNNQIKHNQQVNGITEKLMRQADGHYYSRGTINGEPVLFIVDTGASVLSIPERVAQRIGLQPLEPKQVYTANGIATIYSTRPVSVRLRDIELHGVDAHINPGMDGEAILLGMSFLSRLDFHQRDQMLILKSRPER